MTRTWQNFPAKVIQCLMPLIEKRLTKRMLWFLIDLNVDKGILLQI